MIDPTLVHQVDLFAGLRPDGFVLVNSTKTMDGLGLGSLLNEFDTSHLLTAPATEVARRQIGRPLPNAALIGGFAALTGKVAIGAVGAAIRERFRKDSSLAERNVAAATEMYHYTRQAMVFSGQGCSVLRQIEGSRAVAETVALCRPEVVCAYPISPQTHIIEAIGALVKTGELAPCEFINVESEFAAHVGRDRRLGDRGPCLHRHRQPGAPVHDGGALQRLAGSGCRSS